MRKISGKKYIQRALLKGWCFEMEENMANTENLVISNSAKRSSISMGSEVIRIFAALSFVLQVVSMALGEAYQSVAAWFCVIVLAMIDMAFFANSKKEAVTFWSVCGSIVGAFLTVWFIFFPSWGAVEDYIYFIAAFAAILFLQRQNVKNDEEKRRRAGQMGIEVPKKNTGIVSEVLRLRVAIAVIMHIVQVFENVSYQALLEENPYLKYIILADTSGSSPGLGNAVMGILIYMLIDMAFFAKNRDNAFICWMLIGIGEGIAVTSWCYFESSLAACVPCLIATAALVVVFIIWCVKISRKSKREPLKETAVES